MIFCGTIRIRDEGKSGLQKTIKALALAGVLLAVAMPAFSFYQVNENLKDEIRTGMFEDADIWRGYVTFWLGDAAVSLKNNGTGQGNKWTIGDRGSNWNGHVILDDLTVDSGDNHIKIGILADNFEDGDFSGWTIDGGTWTVENGRLKLSDENSNTLRNIHSNSTVPSSVAIHLDTEYEQESGARRIPVVRWAFQNTSAYYFAYHGFNASNVEIGKVGTSASSLWSVTNMGYTTPSMHYYILINKSNYVNYYVNGILRAKGIYLGTAYMSGGNIALSGTVQSDTYFDNLRVVSVVNGQEKITGNFTTWHNAGTGNETYQICVNSTTPANTNYTVLYRQNGTNSFTKLGVAYTGNSTISLSPGYQNTDVRVVLNGNQTLTPELISITFYDKNKNIMETGSFYKYGPIILIFMALILLFFLGKHIAGKKSYQKENKETTDEKTKEENKGSGKVKRYHIIAIASGKGGVGKTTIAANLGIMLSRLHKKVTIIDMDLAMPNLEIITGLKSTPVGLIDVIEGRLGLDRVTYAGPEGIKIIPPGVMLEGYSKEETKQKITELLKNLPVDNDYIILDMPPGREAIDVLSGKDIGVLLVVNSNKPSILDAVNIKVLLDKKNVNILGVILNRYVRDPELISEIEKTLDSKVVAVIPESKLVNDAYMFEECFVVTNSGSDPSKELMDLAKEIIGN